MNPFNFPSAFPMQPLPVSNLRPPANMSLPPVPAQPPQLDLGSVSMDELSPFGHIGDTINQFVANKQDQGQQNGFAQQILGMRFTPTTEDRIGAYNQNTASLYSPSFKPTSPEEIATNRASLELAPYTTMAKLQSANIDASGGATGALITRLMTENPQQFPTVADALFFIKGGANQGLTSTNGVIASAPGFAGAKSQIAGTVAGAEAGAKNTAEAQKNFPSMIVNSNQALSSIERLKNDKALDAISGMRSMIPVIPGSEGARALANYKQITGQTFLTAYNQLRGGGAITEVEGIKATDAKARLDRAQSKEDIIAALNDLQDVIRNGMSAAEILARGDPMSTPRNLGASSATQGAATHRYNPATGQVEAIQ